MTAAERKEARKNLMDVIKENQKTLTDSDDQQAFQKLLDEPLYLKKIEDPAHSTSLLDPETVFYLKAGAKSSANRCTVYGTNAILGGAYFLNLRQYFLNMAAAGHKNYEQLLADFTKSNCIPLPVGNPFATVQIQNKLVNVTFVPKAQLCGAEIENFALDPLLLDICLTIRAETSRAAIVLSGPVEPKKDTGSLNHMVVF